MPDIERAANSNPLCKVLKFSSSEKNLTVLLLTNNIKVFETNKTDYDKLAISFGREWTGTARN